MGRSYFGPAYAVMKSSTETELIQILNTVLRHKGGDAVTLVGSEAHLRADLHLDSLDLAELTVRIEERFGVDVFEAGIVHRWGEICERVQRYLSRER